MKRIIRLTESDLARIVRRVINEQYNDNWSAPIQQLVDSINQQLPKGSIKLGYYAPTKNVNPTSQMTDVTSGVIFKLKDAGFASDEMFIQFRVTYNKQNVVQTADCSIYDPITNKKPFNSRRTLDPKDYKKLLYPGGGQVNYAVIQGIAKSLRTNSAQRKDLLLLGEALYGQKSKNTQTGAITDYSKIPTQIITSVNDIIKSIDLMVKPTA
jgi:hypothetical protein